MNLIHKLTNCTLTRLVQHNIICFILVYSIFIVSTVEELCVRVRTTFTCNIANIAI